MLRPIAAAASAAVLTLPPSAAAEDVYSLDPVHSQPLFEVQHLGGFSTQRGSFGKIAGKVTLDRAAKKGTVDVTIDTTSIRSLNLPLDAALKGENFFNVAKYPTMTLKSSNLIFDGDQVIGVDGELTLLGMTKPVSLKVANFTCGDNPFNRKTMCGAEATTTIKRSEWGMKYGIPKAVGDKVKITIPIEAYKE